MYAKYSLLEGIQRKKQKKNPPSRSSSRVVYLASKLSSSFLEESQ